MNEMMLTDELQRPKLFYFIGQRSGVGKTQLAWSLPLPVVYIPQTIHQPIHQCFQTLANIVHSDVKADVIGIRDLDKIYSLKAAENLNRFTYKFRTVGLLVSLFKEVLGKSNEESMRMLSGYDGERVITYQPMSIQEARNEIDELVKDYKSKYDQDTTTPLIPVFYLDDFIPHDKFFEYHDNKFLRNVIGCIGCICVQSGTKDDLIFITHSLRDSYDCGKDIMRVVTRLPRTELDAFRYDTKYAHLIPTLSSEVCEMLKSTTPVYAQYVLDALLEMQYNSDAKHADISSSSTHIGHLTAAVLSKAKEILLRDKSRFSRSGGLNEQMTTLSGKVTCVSMEWLLENKANKNSDDDSEEDETGDSGEDETGVGNKRKRDLDSLEASTQYSVRHILGKMPNTDPGKAILTLFRGDYFVCVRKIENRKTQDEEFSPRTMWQNFGNDVLSYFMCVRDGVYFEKKIDKTSSEIRRISTTLGLLRARPKEMLPLFYDRTEENLSLEVVSAAIIASLSYPESLSDCPLDYFLRSIIAELNVNEDYVLLDRTKDMPSQFDDVRVRLLYPSDVIWGENKDNIHSLEHNSVCTSIWESNICRIHGVFPLLLSTIKRETDTPLDVNVPTNEFVRSIYDTVENKHSITLLVCAKLGSIGADNEAFHHPEIAIDVFEIVGNASQDQQVATELRWKPFQIQQGGEMKDNRKHTVIIIELESIYYKRYVIMKVPYMVD